MSNEADTCQEKAGTVVLHYAGKTAFHSGSLTLKAFHKCFEEMWIVALSTHQKCMQAVLCTFRGRSGE